MGEVTMFLLCVGLVLLAEMIIGIVAYAIALKKGRDTVGWFLTGFFFSLPGVLVLVFLPSLETPGQTKRCTSCEKVVGWDAETCRACGASLKVPRRDPDLKVRRPLRSCFLYVALFVLLLLIVFGLIGYFCVPNQSERYSDRMTGSGDQPKVFPVATRLDPSPSKPHILSGQYPAVSGPS